jgi:non-specific serine/threonine protein kinase
MSAVCEVDAASAVEALARLVDRSLVTMIVPRSGPTRYRMLDSLRAYALDRLHEAGDDRRTRVRFTEHFLALAETAAQNLGRRDGSMWLHALDAEHDNCRAVLETDTLDGPELRLRLAVALLDYWHFRGQFAAGRLWLTALIEAARARTVTLARAWLGLGEFQWAQGDQQAAIRSCRRGLAMATRLGDSYCVVQTLHRLAQISIDLDDLRGARRRLAKALEIARAGSNTRQVASCFMRLGALSLAEERFDDAEALLSQSLAQTRRQGDVELQAAATIVLCRLHLRRGQPDLAEQVSAEGLDALREHGSPRQTALLLEAVAAAAAARGDDERGAKLAGAAASTLERIGASRSVGSPLHAPVVALWQTAASTADGQRAWSEGRAMHLSEAINYALREPPAPEAPATEVAQASGLTKRQLEVVRLVAGGLTNQQIAISLHISVRTAEAHLEQIRQKLGFSSRVEIAAWYVQNDQAGR